MKIFLLLSIVLLSALQIGAQITSTTSGGDWMSATTWIGGVVPNTGDDVVIQGPVTGMINCKDMTINTGASVTASGNIHGNILNNGYFDGGQVFVYGNITNKSSFESDELYLKGNAGTEHTIITLGSAPIVGVTYFQTDEENSIVAGSDLHIEDSQIIFHELKLNNFNLYLTNTSYGWGASSIYAIKGTENTISMNEGAFLQHTDVFGKITLIDNGKVWNDVTFKDSVFVEGTLSPNYAGTILKCESTIVNNGTIVKDLIIQAESDVINNGIWDDGQLDMTGLSSDQNVKIDESHLINNIYLHPGLNGSNYQWYKNGSPVGSAETYRLVTVASDDFGEYYCTVDGANSRKVIIGISEPLENDTIYSTLSGGDWTHETTWIGGEKPNDSSIVVIQGPVNGWFSGGDIWIKETGILDGYGNVNGNLRNDGTFKGGQVFVFGDLRNYGAFTSNELYFKGAPGTEHTMICSEEAPVSVPGYFFTDEGGVIIAESDIYIKNSTIIFHELNLGEYGLYLENSSYGWSANSQIKIEGINNVISMKKGAHLQNTDLYGKKTLIDSSSVWSSVNFKDTLIVEGHLFPTYSYTVLTCEETIINNGVIEPDLYIDSKADVINNGEWNDGQLRITGSVQNQNILFNNNSLINNIYMYSSMTGGNFQWYKDGSALDGKTSDELVVFNTATDDFGVYHCVVDGNTSRTISIGNAGEQEIILSEKFDTGTFPPSGWSTVITNSSNTWKLGNIQEKNFSSVDPENVNSAICPWVNQNQDEWLISPVFSLGSGESFLEFYAGFSSDWLGNATMTLKISEDGGANWVQLWECQNDGASWIWREVNIDLSGYAGKTNLKLGWQYAGNDGDAVGIDNVKLYSGKTTDVDDNEEIRTLKYSLQQNYPNPFNPSTNISFSLPASGHVSLKVYDILGNEVKTLVSSNLPAGKHKVEWLGTNQTGGSVSSGVYIYSLYTKGIRVNKKMMLLR